MTEQLLEARSHSLPLIKANAFRIACNNRFPVAFRGMFASALIALCAMTTNAQESTNAPDVAEIALRGLRDVMLDAKSYNGPAPSPDVIETRYEAVKQEFRDFLGLSNRPLYDPHEHGPRLSAEIARAGSLRPPPRARPIWSSGRATRSSTDPGSRLGSLYNPLPYGPYPLPESFENSREFFTNGASRLGWGWTAPSAADNVPQLQAWDGEIPDFTWVIKPTWKDYGDALVDPKSFFYNPAIAKAEARQEVTDAVSPPAQNLSQSERDACIATWQKVMRDFREEDRRLADLSRTVKAAVAESLEEQRDIELAQRHEQELRLANLSWARSATTILVNALNLGDEDSRFAAAALAHFGSCYFQIWETALTVGTASPLFLPVAVGEISSLIFNLAGLGGPNIDYLILEELRALRQDIANFRAEVGLEFALAYEHRIKLTQAILGRINLLERHQTMEFRQLSESARRIEEGLGGLERTILANHEELLNKFATMHKLELGDKRQAFLHALARKDKTQFPHDLFDVVLGALLNGATADSAKALHGGGNTTGIFQYGLMDEAPKVIDPSYLRRISSGPTAVWSHINDLLNLANVNINLREEIAPLKPGRTTSIVNPIAWSTFTMDYLNLALRANDAYQLKTGEARAKFLADLYLAGEEASLGLKRLSQNKDGTANRTIFDDLISKQWDAIAAFERTITHQVDQLKVDFNNVNPFNPEPKITNWVPKTLPISGDAFKSAQRRRENLGGDEVTKSDLMPPTDPLTFSDAERLEIEKRIDKRFRLAQQLELGTIDIDCRDVEYVDVEPYWQNDRGLQLFGRAALVVQVTFRSGGAELPILRQRVCDPAGERTRFAIVYVAYELYANSNPDHRKPLLPYKGPLAIISPNGPADEPIPPFPVPKLISYSGADSLGKQVVSWYYATLQNGAYDEVNFAKRGPEAFKHWEHIKKHLLPDGAASFGGENRLTTDEIAARDGFDAVEKYLEHNVVNFTFDQQAQVWNGIGNTGQAIKDLHTIRLGLLRYAHLAMPGVLEVDTDLMDMLVGKRSVVDWNNLSDVKTTFVPDSNGQVPAAQVMRQRTMALQSHLGKSLARWSSEPERFRHDFLDDTLRHILLAAPALGVSLDMLEKHLTDVQQVSIGDDWILREAQRDFAQRASRSGSTQ